MPIILRRRRLGATSCREIAAKSTTGISVVRNDHNIPDTDLVFRWGCTSNVPTRNVVNTARAIHQVNDKAGFRTLLDEHELCPETLVNSPPTDFDTGWVVRPHSHSQGRRLYPVYTHAEMYLAAEATNFEYYVSRLINKVAEYRVFVVQGRVACVAEKTPGNPDDIAWNVACGGRFDNVRWDNWPLKAVRYSVEAFNLSELDFGGVDVMVDADGEAYVIEINSAPSLTSEYRQTCMAKCFDYIVENGKERIPLTQERGGYRKFIHPAITDKAILV